MPGEIAGEDARSARRHQNGDAVSIITSARSFLHSQVRSMVGSLVWVGERPLERRRSRRSTSRPQPHRLRPGRAAGGSYLVRVEY
jgi:tRNA pseudouridine38-40 synthase